jgi:DNA-binding PadR family transcriptional regulator
MSLNHVLLGLLVPGQRHGYELKRHYDLRFPSARPLASAQIYATLGRLSRDGFVEQGSVERVGGPDRIAYVLTPAGRQELQRWLDAVEEPSPFISNPLSVKVTLAALTSGDDAARSYLRRQREAHLIRMREYTRRKSDPASTLAQILDADYAIEHLNADLTWIDTALARVQALTEELNS